MIRITVDGSSALKFYQAMSLEEKDLHIIGEDQGITIRELVRKNFRSLKSRDFYQDADRKTQSASQGNTTTITIDKVGVRLRWRGTQPGQPLRAGKTISSKTGKPTKFLAIQADKNGKTSSPHECGDLAFISVRNKPKLKGLLVEAESETIKKGKHKGQVRMIAKPNGKVVFWLVSETDHKSNPAIIPSEDEMIKEARDSTHVSLKMIIREARKQ